jgi:hypothetical protein
LLFPLNLNAVVVMAVDTAAQKLERIPVETEEFHLVALECVPAIL